MNGSISSPRRRGDAPGLILVDDENVKKITL